MERRPHPVRVAERGMGFQSLGGRGAGLGFRGLGFQASGFWVEDCWFRESFLGSAKTLAPEGNHHGKAGSSSAPTMVQLLNQHKPHA